MPMSRASMQSMEHYLEDQYQIAASTQISQTLPTGEVVLYLLREPLKPSLPTQKTALAA